MAPILQGPLRRLSKIYYVHQLHHDNNDGAKNLLQFFCSSVIFKFQKSLGQCMAFIILTHTNLSWFYFHIRAASRIFPSFPCLPVNPNTKFIMIISMNVFAIQITEMTPFIPPGSSELHSTIPIWPYVIISVKSCEGGIGMITQWVPSNSYTIETKKVWWTGR